MSIFTNPDIIPETLKLPKANNFMKEIVIHGCARPWYLYFETVFPALMKLFITLLIFDVDDIAREYGKHVSRTRGSGVRTHRKAPARPVLATRETQAQKISRGLLKTVIRVTIPLEVLGFSFLLVAAADQFFADWQALLEAAPFCKNPPSTGPISRIDPPAVMTISIDGQAFGYSTLEQNRSAWATTAFSFRPLSGVLFVVASLKGVAGPAGLSRGALRVRITIAGIPQFITDDFLSVGPGEAVEFVASGRVFVPVAFGATVEWEMVGDDQLGAIFATEGSVFGMIET